VEWISVVKTSSQQNYGQMGPGSKLLNTKLISQSNQEHIT